MWNRNLGRMVMFMKMQWYKNMKMSKKLIVGFLVVALLAATVGVVGVANLLRMKNADTELYERNALALQYSGSVAVNFQLLNAKVQTLATLTSDVDLQLAIPKIKNYAAATSDSLAKCKDIISSDAASTDEIREVIDKIDSLWEIYSGMLDTTLLNVEKGTAVSVGSFSSLSTTVSEYFLQLMTLIANQAESRATNNAEQAQTAIILMAAVILAAIVISVLLGTTIARFLTKQLLEMTSIAGKLAAGDIDVAVMINSTDEMGVLAEAFSRLIESSKEQIRVAQSLAQGDLTVSVDVRSEKDLLNKSLEDLVESLNPLISSIISASDQVAAGSNLVSDSSMVLSQGATEQASSVEELTAAVEEVSSQTNLNAQNADKANELTRDAKADADNGNARMKEMLRAMDEINESSGKINQIIKVIDDIAFQTNILALNAAVEAARAGQHGRGFAVVAEEVRTLAARSAHAAQETTDMIEFSIQKVEIGTKIANDTAEALTQIVDKVDKAANLVGSIAIASREQALGIEQINQGIMQVSQVVQANAATSEESAAASEELSSQAAQLKKTVDVFKVKETGSALEEDAKTSNMPEEMPEEIELPIADPAL